MRALVSAIVSLLILGLAGASANLARAETIGYGEAIQVLSSACGADLESHCKGVKPGGGAIKTCLVNNNASPNCLATIDITFELLAKRAQAQAAAPELCKNDARRHCSEFRAGQARVLRCLIRPDIYRGVSKKCKAALTDAGWN